jgi:hypothetical protein
MAGCPGIGGSIDRGVALRNSTTALATSNDRDCRSDAQSRAIGKFESATHTQSRLPLGLVRGVEHVVGGAGLVDLSPECWGQREQFAPKIVRTPPKSALGAYMNAELGEKDRVAALIDAVIKVLSSVQCDEEGLEVRLAAAGVVYDPDDLDRQRVNGQRSEPTTGLQPMPGIDMQGVVEVPPVAPVPEPDPVPGTPPEVATRDAASPRPVEEPEPEPARRGARLRSLFGKPSSDVDQASGEAVADVDPEEVEEPARVLASRVWASGPSSKTWLRNGLPAASVDRYLQFAQDRNWLDVGREVVARGLVDKAAGSGP